MRVQSLTRAPIVDRDAFLLEAARGRSVLHLGCADAPDFRARAAAGTLLHTRLAGVAVELVGIDISDEGVRFLTNDLGVKDVFVADVEALPRLALGRTFDLVVAGELLEHLPNPGLCLTGLRDLLSGGGSLVLTVPNAFSVKGFMRVLRGVELVHPDHVSYFSATTVGRLLQRCGYCMVSHAYYVSRSVSGVKRTVDAMLLGPVRRCAPYLADGLIVVARVVR